MSNCQKIIFLVSILFGVIRLEGQPGTLEIHPDSIGEYWEMPLSGWALWTKDFPTNIGVKEIATQPFELLEDSVIYIDRKNTGTWFQFGINNLSQKDSLYLFLTFDRYVHKAKLYYKESGKWKNLLAGMHTRYEELAFEKNAWALPMFLSPESSAYYFLYLHKETTKTDSISSIQLVTPALEAKNRAVINTLEFGIRSFNSFLLGAILIFAVFTLAYFAGKKDKAYLYYSLYLFCIFIFYFKNFEAENRSLLTFSLFARWHTNIETLANYASFIFYILFIRHFLNIREADIKLDRLLIYTVWFFVAILPVDLMVQLTLGTYSSIRLLEMIYLPFFLFSFYILWSLWRKRLSPYSKFVIIGTLLLLMGILSFRAAQVLGIRYEDIAWGTMRIFFFQSGDFYWYHTKLGLLMEIVCFMIGLAWKTRQERLEMIQLAIRLKSVESIKRPPRLLVKTAVGPDPQGKPNSHEDNFLVKADAIIEEKYTYDTFLPSQLAAELHISYSHCAHVIKKKTGLSISLYIQKFRLQKAKELLLSTDLPIKQIAYQSGFNSPSYFSRLFKDVFGVSPSEFRNNKDLQ